MFFVYILFSETTESFYKGSSNNIQERMKRHNAGYEKYTSKGIPWKLVWFTEKPTRSEAIILEKKLKNIGFQRTVEFILKYQHEVPGPDELLIIQKLSEY
ncbi:MAG: GIY-YIG nuclease family protein [Bacteroidetes bacterium]|nr:MAG: GIY-YIG nuclease family protein [Bacteroidota bacterium]TNE98700.1 MAG: GIY-YIG nuclease family protein [Bacteroidota bacterium]